MAEITEEMRRHSAAHLMARAVQNVFENVQVDIGPATDDGFYYDFDLPHQEYGSPHRFRGKACC